MIKRLPLKHLLNLDSGSTAKGNELPKQKNKTTYGQWSLAMFLLAVLSGMVLVIPFDVNHPYEAISQILLVNPYASWIRNIHYWSSQLFLVLLLLHLYEHFKNKKSIRLKHAVWFRLTLGLLLLFLVMFTGFLLRGDADTLQARQITEQLIKEIPFFGNLIAYSFFGKPGSYQLIYLNHAATFTIIILIIVFEHSRKLWPQSKTFFYATTAVFILSLLVNAPLHDNIHPTVKGPWFFLGLQDLLHWFSHPQWLWAILIFVLTSVYLSGSKRYGVWFPARRILLVATIIYALLTIDGFFFRGKNWSTVFPWQKNYSYQVFRAYHLSKPDFSTAAYANQISSSPTINGRKEGCLLCHDNVKGLSSSHNPLVTGCFSCHGGNPFTTNKKAAHKTLIPIPGNLSNAPRSCGTANCHPDIVNRVNKGLMATLSGMINVDRYVFNEQNTPDGDATLATIHHSAADEHLKNLCVRCHLGNEKTVTGPVSDESRGGGCLACHLNYSKEAETVHIRHTQQPEDTSWLMQHPSIDLKVTNNHCFGCHSRSGRISTNYEGWHETTFRPADVVGKPDFRVVEQSRVFTKVQDDVHHAAGMDCIDCHTSYELMGDGKTYQHQENQQDVACTDCHTATPDTISPLQLDGESALIAGMRFGSIAGKKLLQTKKHQKPLINTFVINDSVFLTGKNNGKLHYVKPPGKNCLRNNTHKNVSCSACHAAWAPTCIGCHNAYDENEPGYNMVLSKEQRGSWVEYVGEYHSLPPSLGNVTENNSQKIIPVVPGMILTINLQSFNKQLHDSLIFNRLYAPVAPHTTGKTGRSCKSCHNSPLALGYGDGILNFVIKNGKGQWYFQPRYADSPFDGLPEDAWIPMLGTRTGKVSTRSNVTPLSVLQQKKILTVGSCLTCHSEQSSVMQQSLTDFQSVLKNRKKECILPEWPF